MPRIVSAALALMLSQRGAIAGRTTIHMELEAAAAANAISNSGSTDESRHQCCQQSRYCKCDVWEQDSTLKEHYCKIANQPKPLYNMVEDPCDNDKFSNAEVAQCLLKKDKCMLCSAAQLTEVCREAKPCSVLRDDAMSRKNMCDALKDKTLLDGVVATPKYVSKLLYRGTPRVACTEKEISEMCGGVEPLCPKFTRNQQAVEEYCGFIINKVKTKNGHLHTLGSLSKSLGEHGQECSARDLSAICGIPPPNDYVSPCPDFEADTNLVQLACKLIHMKKNFKSGIAATPESTSKVLYGDKGITCSPEDVVKVCSRHH